MNEHQANGVVERAVETVGGMIRTHELAIEESCSQELEAGHVVIPWLIMHAADMVSRFENSSDGKTACERSRRNPYWKRVTSFR